MVDREAGKKQRRFGTDLGLAIFYFIIKTGGRRAAYFILYFVGFHYTLFNAAARKDASWYIQRRFPDQSGLSLFCHVYRLIISLGKVLIDSATVSIQGPESMKSEISDADRKKIFDIIKDNKGFILLTSHTGCWQAAFAALHFIPVPLNLLMHINQDHDYYHLMKRKKGGASLNVIDSEGFLGGTIEMMKALELGQGVAVMGDRVAAASKNSAALSFLGGEALFPYGSFKIASAVNVPVIVLFTSRQGAFRYKVEIADIIKVPAGLGKGQKAYEKYLKRYVSALEDYTEKYPYQFFNFYNMWNV